MAKPQTSTTPEAGVVETKDNQTIPSTDVKNIPVEDATEVESFKIKEAEKKRIAAIFENKPSCEKLFVTTDNSIFDDKGYAISHTKTLKEKQIHVAIRG